MESIFVFGNGWKGSSICTYKLLLGCLWCPIFARRRRVISARLKNRFGFRLGTNTDLFRDVVGPITMPNNYLNTIFDDVISLCWSCRNNARPRSPGEKLNTCCKSLPNKLFVDRPVKYKHIHLDSYKGFQCNIRQKLIK